jgi:NTE family protein
MDARLYRPADQPVPNYRPVALALGGGAALGWAHIGVVQVLLENGLQIAAVAGTSIGAVVGAAVATGKLADLEQIARSANALTVMRFLDLSLKPGGVLGGRTVERELGRHFAGLLMEDTAIPFATVAADLVTGDEVVIRQGSVVEAVRASLAIPGIFTPVVRGDHVLSDGGLVNPVPVSAARQLSSAMVIAVNLQADYQARAALSGLGASAALKTNVVKLTRASMGLLLARFSELALARDPADIVISPSLGHIDVGDFTRAKELIHLGRQAAVDAWPAIAALALPHPDLPKK